MRIDIVGLGPGPAELMTEATLVLLRSGSPVLVGDQGARALVQALAPDGLVVLAEDSSPALIVQELTTLPAGKRVIYAVQGSPLHGSVIDLVPLLQAEGCEVDLRPAPNAPRSSWVLTRKKQAGTSSSPPIPRTTKL